MTNKLNAKIIKNLQKNDSIPSISIYLPMTRGHNGASSNRIHFKNALRTAKRMCERKSIPLSAKRTHKWHKHAATITSNTQLWNTQEKGLAVFINNEGSFVIPLNQKFEKRIFVGSRFITEPLEPIVSDLGQKYWVLALSQKSTRLFSVQGDKVVEKGQNNIPKSLKETLNLDEIGKELQTHMVGSGGNKQSEAFHGHGYLKDNHKKLIDSYLHIVVSSVDKMLKTSKDPLIIIGTAPLLARYRMLSKNKKLTLTNVYANVDHLNGQQIRRLILS